MTKKYIRFINDQLTWIEWKYPWLNDSEIPANNLNDLRPKNNDISIFEFEDEEQLKHIVAAYAVQRTKVDNLDYICFPPEILNNTGIELDQEEDGKTPDDEVNKLHINIIQLSAEKILILAHKILENGETDRCYEEDLFRKIADNIQLGRIPKKGLPGKIREGLTKWGFQV